MTGKTSNLSRTGSPALLTKRSKRQLSSIEKGNRTSNLRRLTQLFNKGKAKRVSEKIISRCLHAMGYWARRECNKPLISTANQKKRAFSTVLEEIHQEKKSSILHAGQCTMPQTQKGYRMVWEKESKDFGVASPIIGFNPNRERVGYITKARTREANSIKQLTQVLKEECEKFPINVVNQLYESIPKRLKEMKK